MLDLDPIQERLDRATAGPWRVISDYIPGVIEVEGPTASNDYVAELSADKADLEFITHARTDVPDLIAEIQRLRALLPPDTVVDAAEHQPSAASSDARNDDLVPQSALVAGIRVTRLDDMGGAFEDEGEYMSAILEAAAPYIAARALRQAADQLEMFEKESSRDGYVVAVGTAVSYLSGKADEIEGNNA